MRSKAMPDLPKTTAGEESLGQLRQRLDEFEAAVAVLAAQPWRGRHQSGQSDEGMRANALVDFVAIAENFSVHRLQQVNPALTDDQLSSWNKRKQRWKNENVDFLVDLAGTWPQLDGFVQVRNALAHGLGALTAMQLERFRAETLTALTACGVFADGGRVRLRDVDVRRCAEVCIAFLLELDNRAALP
jgi:hypothetical protein